MLTFELILLVYAFISLVLPLPWRWYGKVVALLVIALVDSKLHLYNFFGTRLDPNLPLPIILLLEILFATLIIAVFLAMLKDVLLLCFYVVTLICRRKFRPWPAKWLSLGIVLVALGQASYGTFSQFAVPDVKVVPIVVNNLPASLQGTHLVQLSDLHVGPLLKGEFVSKVVSQVNALNPAVVMITGDVVDGSIDEVGAEFDALAKLQASWDVLGVTGNHEYYCGMEPWVALFERHGVDFLFNESLIYRQDNFKLKIVGLPDRGADLTTALSGEKADFTLLMSHRPNIAWQADGVDLTVSGHTHGGAMFFLQPLISPYNAHLVSGMYHIDDRLVYVSNGTGIWSNYACRFGVPAEITCFVLVPPPAR